MQSRENALRQWLITIQQTNDFNLMPLAGDASFRRYWRLQQQDKTWVVMDAPPGKEDLIPFIQVNRRLAQTGIRVPTIHATASELGFLLLEDFGDQVFLNVLKNLPPQQKEAQQTALYQKAINTLLVLQQGCSKDLPLFDRAFMLKELELFRTWFLDAYLGFSLQTHETQLINDTFSFLVEQLAQQPQVMIHRDYHSRNLMILDEPENHLGVIDFQDAMSGPFTYDLVSLLKDCYIQWPRERVVAWAADYYQQTSTFLKHHPIPSLDQFIRDFDICGLQRHLKVLGIFCRLHLRDHKSNYLADLPLTFHYVLGALATEPRLKSFYEWMRDRVKPAFLAQQTVTAS